ncbi:Outer membrane protein beta-barrel family protein [Mucilaginibacter gossypiicola]|uniref:Outer membrane protein beta-barrel family protein n=1 Tax=Mucilaginibacter gossypiicola TaxID=551995 RepID=A0A1H8ET58_9SPHI|nr:outer membrane beta-barrel protein [Mucilaginibacter gossypiicola]SEN21928.1 Outer membrane protein beta-barrel family protein [Mucilaginibacter gossypiicola]
MKTIFLSLILLCLFSVSFAQNRVNIKGKVIDSISRQPLELSTIAAVDLKDTSLIAYTLSKKTGEFELQRLPPDKQVRLVVSYAGYKSYIRRFDFKKGEVIDLGNIALNSKMLEEVVVRAERVPIKMKKDTIEFDAAAFKTRPNAAVEELLKKLPGVQVDGDGTITVNGKQVSKLLIDGKQFFGSDPKIATKNLDAAIVAQVQVYDDRENDPDHLVSETQVQKIINIKLKKAIKKSIFGKVFGGVGSRDRYEAGGLFNMFRDTLQVSVIGLSNNLNHTAFSREELNSEGGFDRSGGNTSFNGGRNWGGGIEKITSGGFNVNQNYGEKLKLNLQYFYTQRNNVNESANFQQQFLKDTTLLTRSSNNRYANSYTHTVSGLVEWKPDTIRNLRYNPSLNYNSNNNTSASGGSTSNNFDMPVNQSVSNSLGNGHSTQFNQSFYFHKRSKNKSKESFTISHNLSISPNHNSNFNNNDVVNYQRPDLSDSLHRLSVRTSKNASGNLDFSYRFPVTKKLIVDVTTSGIYNKTSDQVFTYDRKTGGFDSLLNNQSSDLKRDQWTENIKPGITYQLNKKTQIIAGLNTQWQQIDNNFVTSKLAQNYFFLLPTVRVEAYGVSLSYERRVNQPNISSLQPITIIYSPLYSYTGNPNLVPGISNTYYINFFKYFNDSQLGIYSYGNISSQKNMAVAQQTIRSDGAQTNTTVNRDGRPSYSFSVGVFKRFKKMKDWQLGSSTNFYGNYYQNLNLLNNVEGWQNTVSYGVHENINVNWKDVIDLNTGVGFNQSNTKYNYDDFRNVKVGTYNISNSLVVRFPKKIIWETKQDFNYNSQVAAGFKKGVNVVSSSLALQMLKKDRGELKFSVYDIFNQNVSVYRYINNNSVSDVQNNTLKRYFLITYSVKFNKLSTK